MEKFLANLFLLVVGLSLMLANYWYTFGLWPKSWVSFFACGIAGCILMVLNMSMQD